MNEEPQNVPAPAKTALKLLVYYVLLISVTMALIQTWPSTRQYLPMGGHTALDGLGLETIQEFFTPTGEESSVASRPEGPPEANLAEIQWFLAFTLAHLLGTVLAMLPIALTYTAVSYAHGFRQNFVHTLILLPVCATTIVMLIQNSLALAFGLAALVAAVRFRVALEDARDGIFIFAAICVGLATGIGHLGVALLMGIFFCFASVLMWSSSVGENPLDEARIARKRAKLDPPQDEK